MRRNPSRQHRRASPLVSLCFAYYHSPMSEREVRYRLGAVQSIAAETFGRPGRRTFRLVAEAGRAQSSIWLEKEQLLQLGLYLQQAVKQLGESAQSRPSSPGEDSWIGDPLEQDFHARQMQLQYDQDANCFVIHAYEGDEDDPEAVVQTSVSFWMTMSQCSQLADQVLRICASGRPPCFLCGRPIDPDGHLCDRASSHAVFETG